MDEIEMKGKREVEIMKNEKQWIPLAQKCVEK